MRKRKEIATLKYELETAKCQLKIVTNELDYYKDEKNAKYCEFCKHGRKRARYIGNHNGGPMYLGNDYICTLESKCSTFELKD